MSSEKFIKNKTVLITLVSACAIVIISLGIRQTFGMFYFDFSTDLGITLSQFGFSLGLQMFLWGAFAPLFGVITDKYGVPHIYSDTEEDLFFAQGFIHARDRAWQMEMNRRVAHGQVAEAFGDIALDTDRLVRTLGFNKLAREDYAIASDETKNILTCYSNGVNAFFKKESISQ